MTTIDLEKLNIWQSDCLDYIDSVDDEQVKEKLVDLFMSELIGNVEEAEIMEYICTQRMDMYLFMVECLEKGFTTERLSLICQMVKKDFPQNEIEALLDEYEDSNGQNGNLKQNIKNIKY